MKTSEMKVKDVLQTDVFRRRMAEQLAREENTQRQAAYKARANGTRLNRMVLDSLREKGVLNGDDMTELFKAVLNKSLVGFSGTERAYIRDIGTLVYRQAFMELRKQEGGEDGKGETEV